MDLRALMASEFVLCVGTIEIRKNPSYLLDIWKLLIDAGRDTIPTLVFAGRKGWLVDDFFERLKGCDYLDGKVVLLHDLSDKGLEALYRGCLLTMFPSFEEGWGLPVGESLSHGKICLASDAGGIKEAGGAFADYIDPHNVRDGYARLTAYLDNPDLRARREKEIGADFVPRPWLEYAEGIMAVVKEQRKTPPAAPAITAVSLPANAFLAIGRNLTGTAKQAAGGHLSAESACISGWGAPQTKGMPALGPRSLLRFRSGLPEGSKATIIFRLVKSGIGPCRVRIRSGACDSQAITIAPGSGRAATLYCECGPDGLVTIVFERTDIGRLLSRKRSSWALAGLLYISPEELDGVRAGPPGEKRTARDLESSTRLAPSTVEYQNVRSRAAFLRTPDSRWPAATKSNDASP